MSSSNLRIAILECDTPVPAVAARLGSYGDIFEILLNSGADLLAKDETTPRPTLTITKYNVVERDTYPDPGEVDAVLLTGSKHNSFDSSPWILRLVEYTASLLSHSRVKIIGICFGHQIVGRAMGAKVARSPGGWEVSVTPMKLTSKGREVFGIGGEGEMRLHQMHQDVVFEYPEGTEGLAHTDKCSTQGFYKKGKVVTVQGHPEFSGFITGAILGVRHEAGVIKDDLYKDAMSRVEGRHDGVVAAKAFLKFVLEG